ncbi:hypothetical protein ENBRE01_3342 [Enteropsectra breve]|nr:hypothetical protein ENBRE01_3342 [Enteropsectra breve]
MRLAVQREDQKKAELYCLDLFETYKVGCEKKNQKDTLKIIPEATLKTMREKEYNHFRVHAAGMIASARQSEGVSTAEDRVRIQMRETSNFFQEIRFSVWKHLLPLPEERNDEIFDSYIPLAYLVAELKQQRETKKSGYRKGQELLKANNQVGSQSLLSLSLSLSLFL